MTAVDSFLSVIQVLLRGCSRLLPHAGLTAVHDTRGIEIQTLEYVLSEIFGNI